ncbi:MAG: DUF996 domain-containing protein [Sulfolobales archaeon]
MVYLPMSTPQPSQSIQGQPIQPSKLPQAKVYGGVGSILVLLAIVPYVGFILALIGLVFILIALKYISDEVGEPKIFRYALYSFIAGVVGAVILAFIVLSAIIGFFAIRPSSPITIIGPTTPPLPPQHGMQQGWIFQNGFIGFIIAILGALIAIWVSQIISAIFLKTSYDAIAKHLGVGLFSTVAILYVVGAVLTIILIGLLITFVALIIQIVAFFSIPETRPQKPQSQIPGASQ